MGSRIVLTISLAPHHICVGCPVGPCKVIHEVEFRTALSRWQKTCKCQGDERLCQTWLQPSINKTVERVLRMPVLLCPSLALGLAEHGISDDAVNNIIQ